ncbi:hypothetical protein CC77DRAFT_724252 [Alternaria alternata]|uniref:Uncharacterized protein n=1 Tax=Alternaria alternata TaxID=5599 RepID=A0A177D2I0_ALTAL|nr:hypothetical protein CC77DRAFT_724252 [Alternaria alternata]OAG13239.1 hypothetical protein CC77DRAFT_724252 [Alternaria alternata]
MMRRCREINGIASRNVVPLKFAAGVLLGPPMSAAATADSLGVLQHVQSRIAVHDALCLRHALTTDIGRCRRNASRWITTSNDHTSRLRRWPSSRTRPTILHHIFMNTTGTPTSTPASMPATAVTIYTGRRQLVPYPFTIVLPR